MPALRADQRLFLTYLLLIALVVGSLTLAAGSALRGHLRTAAEDDLRRELLLARELYDRSPELAPDSFARVISRLSGRRASVFAADGERLGESGAPFLEHLGPADLGRRPEVRGALEGSIPSVLRRSESTGEDHLYVAVLTRRGEVLRLAAPVARIDAPVGQVQRSIFGVGGVAVLLAAAFSLGFSFVVTRPIRRMRNVARAMAAGDLSRRLRERRRDELGELAESLDALADELQRRLAQLERERIETQTLIDSMSEGVLAFSAGGTLRRANPAARRMFSLPPRPETVPPEAVSRQPEFLRLVRRALAGEATPLRELPGEGRHLLGTAHPLPDGGAVLVFLDVSELRRLEDVRRDFVANASHELKTPLTAIRGYSETLLDHELPPELARRFTEIVRSNAERLQRIVDDLLDLSRIESGGWCIRPETISIHELALEAWGAEAEARGSKAIDFELDLAPDAERAFADAAAIRQVLGNLFSNAGRYTPAGGRIGVRSRLLPAGPAGHRAGGMVQIEVSDTGGGIPAAHLTRIFERFYRVDPARSRAEGGTGLGLAIVRHLVEAHGGGIEAESRLGRGTTLRFTLPAAPPAGEQARPPAGVE
jgi:two-component system, OmpR family, phosphate regulon sensor histidine kinase PhoR